MTTDRYVVDVLVCTRDGEQELPTLLVSLALQEFSNFRVIIRDESQTGTILHNRLVPKMMDLLAHQGVPVAYHRDWNSRGIAHARHCILELASSPYIWFIDDDVVAEPSCLARLVETAEDRKCGYVQGAKVSVDNFYGFSSFSPAPIVSVDHDQPRIFARYAEDTVVPINIGDTANILFDRTKLLDCGGFSFFNTLGDGLLGEDWIAAALTSDRYGGLTRTGAIAWHLGREKKPQPFKGDRQFVLNYLKDKVSPATLQAVEKAWF